MAVLADFFSTAESTMDATSELTFRDHLLLRLQMSFVVVVNKVKRDPELADFRPLVLFLERRMCKFRVKANDWAVFKDRVTARVFGKNDADLLMSYLTSDLANCPEPTGASEQNWSICVELYDFQEREPPSFTLLFIESEELAMFTRELKDEFELAKSTGGNTQLKKYVLEASRLYERGRMAPVGNLYQRGADEAIKLYSRPTVVLVGLVVANAQGSFSDVEAPDVGPREAARRAQPQRA